MAPKKEIPEKTRVTVTSENFGDLLVESLKQAVDIKEGRAKPAVLRQYPVTVKNADVEAPPVPTAEEIRGIREALNLSQPVFSAALNVSTATSRSWEQRKRVPDGASLRLLQIVRENPRLLLGFIDKKRATRNGSQNGTARRGHRPVASRHR